MKIQEATGKKKAKDIVIFLVAPKKNNKLIITIIQFLFSLQAC